MEQNEEAGTEPHMFWTQRLQQQRRTLAGCATQQVTVGLRRALTCRKRPIWLARPVCVSVWCILQHQQQREKQQTEERRTAPGSCARCRVTRTPTGLLGTLQTIRRSVSRPQTDFVLASWGGGGKVQADPFGRVSCSGKFQDGCVCVCV